MESAGWRGDGAESAGNVLGSGQGRGGESAQVAGVRWVFKSAAVHRTKYASAGGGVSESKYSIEPKGKVAQAAEGNVTGRIRPKTGIKSGLRLWIVGARSLRRSGRGLRQRLCLIIRGLMLGMGIGSSVSSTFRVFSSALRYCYASLEFMVLPLNSSRPWYVRPSLRLTRNLTDATANCYVLC